MGRVTPQTQLHIVIKLLVTVLIEPTITTSELAKALDVQPTRVARLLMSFREAGVHIDYDFKRGRYNVALSDALEKSVLGKFLTKVRRAMSDSASRQPPVRFVTSLENYSLIEFAEMVGTSPSNVYNMVINYKGATLPAGWIAYQMQERSKWRVTKMTTDRTGKIFEVPEMLLHAFRTSKGSGTKIDSSLKRIVTKCQAVTLDGKKEVVCKEPVLFKGYCRTHYYQQRRHPERFLEKKN